MIEVTLQRRGDAYFPFSEEDRAKGRKYLENQPLRAKLTGAKKARSYRELCCYWGSCRYIASLNLNGNMNTENKVDHMTRIKLGFTESPIYLEEKRTLTWIPKRLDYSNCDQPEAHAFIAAALEEHAQLAGIDDVERYVEMLRNL